MKTRTRQHPLIIHNDMSICANVPKVLWVPPFAEGDNDRDMPLRIVCMKQGEYHFTRDLHDTSL